MNQVCLVTALPSESRLFIDHYRLQLVKKSHWRLYANNQLLLVETGIGKLNAAAAVASVLHTHSNISALINIGIVGAAQPIGSCWLAHLVVDWGTEYHWYPHLPPKAVTGALGSLSLVTLDKPSSSYIPERMMDMEAAGIVAAAKPYLANHAMQFIKIVSDNAQADHGTLNKLDIQAVMQSALEPTSALVTWFQREGPHPNKQDAQMQSLCLSLTTKQHYTQTQQHLLERKLQQLANLSDGGTNNEALLQTRNAKATLALLDQLIAECELIYTLDD